MPPCACWWTCGSRWPRAPGRPSRSRRTGSPVTVACAWPVSTSPPVDRPTERAAGHTPDVTTTADLVLSGGLVFDGERVAARRDRGRGALRPGRRRGHRRRRARSGRPAPRPRGPARAAAAARLHRRPRAPGDGGRRAARLRPHRCRTAAETLERVRRPRRAPARARVGRRRRLAKEAFEHGRPTAAALDDVVGDRPALLRDNSHHAVWVSSAALRLAGLDAATPDPPDGQLSRLPDGRPAGTLHEAAMDLVARHLPPTAARRPGRRPAGRPAAPALPRRHRLAGRHRRQLRRPPRPDRRLPGRRGRRAADRARRRGAVVAARRPPPRLPEVVAGLVAARRRVRDAVRTAGSAPRASR